jgi:hypothetical protein
MLAVNSSPMRSSRLPSSLQRAESITSSQLESLKRREDYQERKFFARGLVSFSSEKLGEFLAFLEQVDPTTFAPRRGGESFHIDFHALNDQTYTQVRGFLLRNIPLLDPEEEDELMLDVKPPPDIQRLSALADAALADDLPETRAPEDAPPLVTADATMKRQVPPPPSSRFVNGTRKFRQKEDQQVSLHFYIKVVIFRFKFDFGKQFPSGQVSAPFS